MGLGGKLLGAASTRSRRVGVGLSAGRGLGAVSPPHRRAARRWAVRHLHVVAGPPVTSVGLRGDAPRSTDDGAWPTDPGSAAAPKAPGVGGLAPEPLPSGGGGDRHHAGVVRRRDARPQAGAGRRRVSCCTSRGMATSARPWSASAAWAWRDARHLARACRPSPARAAQRRAFRWRPPAPRSLRFRSPDGGQVSSATRASRHGAPAPGPAPRRRASSARHWRRPDAPLSGRSRGVRSVQGRHVDSTAALVSGWVSAKALSSA